MSDTSDWRPGLPDHPCVCDLRSIRNGKVLQEWRMVHHLANGNHVIEGMEWEPYKRPVEKYYEWRPIEVPDASPPA